MYNTLEQYLNDALNNLVIPILYFDTNVYIDILFNRNKSSSNLYGFVCQKKWECVTSVFSKVETLEVKQIHKFKELKRSIWSSRRINNEIHKRDLNPMDLGNVSRSISIRRKNRCSGFKEYSAILEEGWIKAEEIKRKTNLTDKDSIHLAEAIAIACDVLISRDDFLLSVSNKYIWSMNPDQFLVQLRNLGVRV
jgi:predicted nucleic acid-binding protein